VTETLVIGLDGATWVVLDPLMERGLMPALDTLVRAGARAPLRTVMPPLTPPGWTSLMTGRTPAQHGVFDFFRRESPSSEYFRLTTAQDIVGDTIWTQASRQGKRVLSLNFPVMFPAPAVLGRVIPGGWMPWRQLRLGCYPPGLFDRLKDLPSFDAKELSLDMALEAKAVEGCPPEEYADWVELHIRREERWFEVAQTLLADEPAELVGIVFDGVDKLQHLCWRFLDPARRSADPQPWEEEMTAACERYFVRLDGIIARLVALAGPDATVIVASDHGFGPTDELFFVNSWLAEQGFLAWAEDGSAGPTAATDVGFAQMTRHITLLDWSRTLAYAATPSSQGIHVVAKDPRTGRPMTATGRAEICQEITKALLTARHPGTGAPLVSRVWPGETAFGTSHTGIAPDLAVELPDGMAFSIIRSPEVVLARDEPKGNHRWLGICSVTGPGVRVGDDIPELSICDVAPMVLHSLGLAVPAGLDGRLPAEVYPSAQDLAPAQEDRLTLQLPEPAYAGSGDPGDGYDSESEAVVVARLRALGYLD
jgi:predicted AlkP superfamily phosphohydrolase/phosphomutase